MINTSYNRMDNFMVCRLASSDNLTKRVSDDANANKPSGKCDTYQATERDNVGVYSRETVNHVESVSLNTANKTAYNLKYLPQYVAGKIAGITVYDGGTPSINSATDSANWQNAFKQIQGDHSNLYVKNEYRYSQTGSNNYGFSDPQSACAAFAFATALSIKNNKSITPTDISVSGSGMSPTGEERLGSSAVFQTKDGQYKGYRMDYDSESDLFLQIDTQLELGNPVLIRVQKNGDADLQHWATVIGKENGKYSVVDPYYGTTVELDQMQIRKYYPNDSEFTSCIILSDQY